MMITDLSARKNEAIREAAFRSLVSYKSVSDIELRNPEVVSSTLTGSNTFMDFPTNMCDDDFFAASDQGMLRKT
jgi:hypothetical protein